MKKKGFAKLCLGVLCALGAFNASASCQLPTSITPGGPSIQSAVGVDEIWANYAVYEWSEAEGKWVIIFEDWSQYAESLTLEPGDDIVPATVILQPGSGSGGGGGWTPNPPRPIRPFGEINPTSSGIAANCSDRITNLPERVTATGVRPPARSTMTIIRSLFTKNSTGGGAGSRRNNVGIKTVPNMSCASSEDDRYLAALDELKPVLSRGIYVIRYGDNSYQAWAITEPLFSEKGLQRVGNCVTK